MSWSLSRLSSISCFSSTFGSSFARSMIYPAVCLSFLMACLICPSLTRPFRISTAMASESSPSLVEKVAESVEKASKDPEAVTSDGQADEVAGSDEGSDSGAGQSGEEAPEGESDESEGLAVQDDEAEVRGLDFEAPEAIVYAGIGCCLGALLGSVFTRSWGNWGDWGARS